MSIRRYMIFAAVLASFVAVFALGGASASASLGEFSLFGEIPREGGESDEGLAVDESTDDVYVYDSEGRIFKYDANGNPVDFSALGSNVIMGVGGYGGDETELAVDNSSGPAKGDIYLAAHEGETDGEIKIYGPDGKALGALTKVSGRPWGETCGVAVDGAGNVYVGLYPETIDKFTPSADPVSNNDYVGAHFGFHEICQIGADHDGRIYATAWAGNRNNAGSAVRLDSFDASGASLLLASAGGTVTAANAPSDEVFVSHKGNIFQYDPQGNLLSTFGSGEAEAYYNTLAINAKDGRLYAFIDSNRKVQIWQGVFTPEIRTLEFSGPNVAGSAILNGSVNPEGTTVESCSFEYGPTAAYGTTIPCAQSTPLTGTIVTPVSTNVTGLTLNHTYHYRLTAVDSHKEFDGTDQTFSILVRPEVEGQQPSASEITRSTARLSGAVAPQESETRYFFQYGTTEEYGDATAVEHTGDLMSGEVPVSLEAAGLLPETLYHYRLVAANVAGTTYGADHTLVSGAPDLPEAMTGGAVNIAQNTATITGTVNTNGLPSSYGFEIGTSTDYGPPTGLGYVGAGANEAPASLQLTGLQPGTTYHYRLTATNVDGTAYGVDHTFTTGVYASTFAEPPAPLPFVTVPQIAFPAEAKVIPTKKKTTKKKTKPKSKKHKKRKSRQHGRSGK